MELNKEFNDWNIFDKKIDFLTIAGPCSAENEEQMFNTAEQLKNNIHLFRSGIWKPRTRPGSFEGVGETGLKWLNEIKKKYNIKTTVEIATREQTELALKYGIDVLWIGARTTVNPFSVQSIADVLKGVDIPIMIKNPMNPDLSLWIGAFERFYKAGIIKLAAIHRGFSTHQEIRYRNMPMWNIPIEFKRRFPNLPLIIDPSHISGKKEYIQKITQHSINFGYNGMIVEVHNNPSVALSDKDQQLTPNEFINFYNNLEFKNKEIFEFNDIDKHRSSINELDSLLLSTISDRMNIVRKIGEIKKDQNISILQVDRWKQILEDKLKDSKKYELSEDFIFKLFELIHSESLKQQNNIINEKIITEK